MDWPGVGYPLYVDAFACVTNLVLAGGAGKDRTRFQKGTAKKRGLAIELARATIASPYYHKGSPHDFC